MDQQSDTPTGVSMIVMPKVPAYPSVDNMSTEKAVDPSTNQHQIHDNPEVSSYSLLRLRGGCGCIAGCLAGMGCVCLADMCCCCC